MIGLLGKKLGMTQIFDPEGKNIPVTVLQVGPCPILDVKSKEKHGYQAIQLGFDEKKEPINLNSVILRKRISNQCVLSKKSERNN